MQVAHQYWHLLPAGICRPVEEGAKGRPGALAVSLASSDLLIVDLEMPGLDGAKVLSYAVSKGMNKNRIVILSGRSAEYLHERFPMGSCLAVLNKHEGEQKKVLDMIFSALEKKRGVR